MAATPATTGTARAGTPAPSAAAGYHVATATRLAGELELPGDKSISHRALMLALLADGHSTIRGAAGGRDVRSTAAIVRALGASVESAPGDGSTVDYEVESAGIDGLREPAGRLDCGNSGTTLRLFAGVLAGQPMTAVLDGDASLRGRPVARIIEPLRSMGAVLHGRRQDSLPPVTVIGRTRLRALDWSTPVPSAQVKSAILLAALRADGTTRIREAVATRDHTERMLRARGVAVRSILDGGRSAVVEIEGGGRVHAVDDQVPGDPSAAAFWLVAAAIHPDAELRLSRVGVNPTRRAAIDLLRAMGADIREDARDHAAPDGSDDERGGPVGEPTADLSVRSSALCSIDVDPADTSRAIDEIPILALAATQAVGRTRFRGAGELRHKESNRLDGISRGLRALGATVGIDGDDLVVDGPTPLVGAAVDSLGDHRLAMTFAVAGLVARGRTSIAGAGSADVSYPTFFADLERIQP